MLKLFSFLQQHGLLPIGMRDEVLMRLDQEFAVRYGPHPGVPYSLRARALSHALSAYELGRCLYHLGQRRGFKSNRRAPIKESNTLGEVDRSTKGLRFEIERSGSRTLGSYLARLETGKIPGAERIRGRYTLRSMYEEEFDAILNEQKKHHSLLEIDIFRSQLRDLMFFQRPLKDQSDRVGNCSLLPSEKRARALYLDVQRWRILDRINSLRLSESGQALNEAQRKTLLDRLMRSESLRYDQARKLLDISGPFSIESGPEKSVLGNITFARFEKALGTRWTEMQRTEQDRLVDLWVEAADDDSFRAALNSHGRFTAQELDNLLGVQLPDGTVGFSLAAIRRLLPFMEAGMTTMAAINSAGLEVRERSALVSDVLPPVADALPELRNPAVARSLTELRKAVNEIILRYGKPSHIRIELARDLKRNKRERAALTRTIEDNRAKRDRARSELLNTGLQRCSRDDETKYLLWEECGRTCPYSGDTIGLSRLFEDRQFDIEHIIPYSRSIDDSFSNLTLCRADYNQRKGNRTPREAFGSTEEWDEMIARVRKFNNPAKLRRFLLQETEPQDLLSSFTSNELNDTRYMSKLAGRYLGSLYGTDANKRIGVCAGRVTAFLRRAWDLNRLLGDKPEKSREDHRHHAIDAVIIALVDRSIIKELALASERAERLGQRRLRSLAFPWASFRDELSDRIRHKTIVSHRPERKLSGQLHKETFYGRPHKANGKSVVHARIAVEDLTGANIENIVDPTVRERVHQCWVDAGKNSKKLANNPPMMESGTPIYKVRVKLTKSIEMVGIGAKRRAVVAEKNHHMAIYRVESAKGTRYVGRVVSLLEANRRHRSEEPIIVRETGPNERFLFSLSEGDMVQWNGELWRVRGVSAEMNGRLILSRAVDARRVADMSSADKPRPSANQFCSSGGQKVAVSPIGFVSDSND